MMAVGSYWDRAGVAVPAALARELLAHLRQDEMRAIVEASGECELCRHLWVFHDHEGYYPCEVGDCKCTGLDKEPSDA